MRAEQILPKANSRSRGERGRLYSQVLSNLNCCLILPPLLAGLNIQLAPDLRQGSIEVRTSLMQVRHIPQGGPITTNRVDMSIGGSKGKFVIITGEKNCS